MLCGTHREWAGEPEGVWDLEGTLQASSGKQGVGGYCLGLCVPGP